MRAGLTNEGLEPGTLTGPGLLLDGHDLQDLVLEGGPEEEIHDLELLGWKRRTTLHTNNAPNLPLWRGCVERVSSLSRP